MCRLRSASASWASWQKHLADFLTKQVFARCKADACLFFSANFTAWLLIWVGDIVVAGPDEFAITNFKTTLATYALAKGTCLLYTSDAADDM
eukprot:7517578-Alexandrium_andersonii.AAC.1